jgi:hypothetical protein
MAKVIVEKEEFGKISMIEVLERALSLNLGDKGER